MSARSHEPWSVADERDLVSRFRRGEYPGNIAKEIGRTELAVRARLSKFRLLPPVTAEDIERYRAIRSSHIEAVDQSDQSSPGTAGEGNQQSEVSDRFQATIDVQQAFHRFHFVYAIVNPTGHVYVGYTQDVWHRIGRHNRDLGAVATRNCGPWFPFAIYCFAAEVDARSMESQIHGSFAEFTLRVEVSLREVLAQIGVPITRSQLRLI